MEAIKYDPNVHYREVCEWARARLLGDPPFSGLPRTGRIVPGKCALFLYQTDSTVGFVESMISNPEIEKHEIPEAIDLCGKALEQDARLLGIKYLLGSSFLPAVADHAKRNGWTVKPESYRLLAKELKEGLG